MKLVMKMRAFTLGLFIFVIGFMPLWLIGLEGVPAGANATIHGLVKPVALVMDDRYLYVGDGSEVVLFDRTSLKEKLRFGKSGEGPGEFLSGKNPLTPRLLPDEIAVASAGKISFWSMTGRFIREKSYSFLTTTNPIPIKSDRYLGLHSYYEDTILYCGFAVYDADMNPLRVLSRCRHPWQKGRPTKLAIYRFLGYRVFGGRLYVPGSEENEIDVYDEKCEKKGSLTIPRCTIPVDRGIRNQYMDYVTYKTILAPRNESNYEFPEYLPSIRFIGCDDKCAYVFSWDFADGQIQYHPFDVKTFRSLEPRKVPYRTPGMFEMYPYTVWKGVFYQLVEDEDENWCLTQETLN